MLQDCVKHSIGGGSGVEGITEEGLRPAGDSGQGEGLPACNRDIIDTLAGDAILHEEEGVGQLGECRVEREGAGSGVVGVVEDIGIAADSVFTDDIDGEGYAPEESREDGVGGDGEVIDFGGGAIGPADELEACGGRGGKGGYGAIVVFAATGDGAAVRVIGLGGDGEAAEEVGDQVVVVVHRDRRMEKVCLSIGPSDEGDEGSVNGYSGEVGDDSAADEAGATTGDGAESGVVGRTKDMVEPDAEDGLIGLIGFDGDGKGIGIGVEVDTILFPADYFPAADRRDEEVGIGAAGEMPSAGDRAVGGIIDRDGDIVVIKREQCGEYRIMRHNGIGEGYGRLGDVLPTCEGIAGVGRDGYGDVLAEGILASTGGGRRPGRVRLREDGDPIDLLELRGVGGIAIDGDGAGVVGVAVGPAEEAVMFRGVSRGGDGGDGGRRAAVVVAGAGGGSHGWVFGHGGDGILPDLEGGSKVEVVGNGHHGVVEGLDAIVPASTVVATEIGEGRIGGDHRCDSRPTLVGAGPCGGSDTCGNDVDGDLELFRPEVGGIGSIRRTDGEETRIVGIAVFLPILELIAGIAGIDFRDKGYLFSAIEGAGGAEPLNLRGTAGRGEGFDGDGGLLLMVVGIEDGITTDTGECAEFGERGRIAPMVEDETIGTMVGEGEVVAADDRFGFLGDFARLEAVHRDGDGVVERREASGEGLVGGEGDGRVGHGCFGIVPTEEGIASDGIDRELHDGVLQAVVTRLSGCREHRVDDIAGVGGSDRENLATAEVVGIVACLDGEGDIGSEEGREGLRRGITDNDIPYGVGGAVGPAEEAVARESDGCEREGAIAIHGRQGRGCRCAEVFGRNGTVLRVVGSEGDVPRALLVEGIEGGIGMDEDAVPFGAGIGGIAAILPMAELVAAIGCSKELKNIALYPFVVGDPGFAGCPPRRALFGVEDDLDVILGLMSPYGDCLVAGGEGAEVVGGKDGGIDGSVDNGIVVVVPAVEDEAGVVNGKGDVEDIAAVLLHKDGVGCL